MAKRKNYSPTFKVKVALAAISGEKTLAELSSEDGIYQTMIGKWKKMLLDSAAGIFSGEIKSSEAARVK